MNFFTVGFLLANLQLNANWASGYFIRLVGALFMLGGIAELSGFDEKIRSARPICILLALLSAASGATALAAAGKTGIAARAACELDAMVTTGFTAIAFRQLFALLNENTSLVGDIPGVKRTSKGYDRMLAVMALALLADCVNRFTSGIPADASGVVMAISRVITYVMLAAETFRFNRLRSEFNRSHPIE